MNEHQFLNNLRVSNPTYCEVIEGYKSIKRGIAQVAKMSGFSKTLPATGLLDDDYLDCLFDHICPIEDDGVEDEHEHDDDDRDDDDGELGHIDELIMQNQKKKMKKFAEEHDTEKVVAPLEHYKEWASW